MIIGEELYAAAAAAQTLAREYVFKPAGEIPLGLARRDKYPVYYVKGKAGRSIIQPFRHRPQQQQQQ